MKVDVLGTTYEIKVIHSDKDAYLNDMDGYCDETVKEIVVDDMQAVGEHSKKELKVYQNNVIRHELIHAFLFESGLANSSTWAQNEELVDWIAIQFPKMEKIFRDLNII